MTDLRVMPDPVRLGEHIQSTMLKPFYNWEHFTHDGSDRRALMGYYLPSWQRGLVWTDAQNVRFLESAWRGLNVGTFTVNLSPQYSGPFDGLLIDGQQRMHALQRYFEGAFQVFGYRWHEVTEADRSMFLRGRHFASYITKTDDEAYLREYYNLMNFGGVAHKPGEKA